MKNYNIYKLTEFIWKPKRYNNGQTVYLKGKSEFRQFLLQSVVSLVSKLTAYTLPSDDGHHQPDLELNGNIICRSCLWVVIHAWMIHIMLFEDSWAQMPWYSEKMAGMWRHLCYLFAMVALSFLNNNKKLFFQRWSFDDLKKKDYKFIEQNVLYFV